MLNNLLLVVCFLVIVVIAARQCPRDKNDSQVSETTIQQDQVQGDPAMEISDPELATICRVLSNLDLKIIRGEVVERQDAREALAKLNELTKIPFERRQGVQCSYKIVNGKYYWPMEENWAIEGRRQWLLRQLLP